MKVNIPMEVMCILIPEMLYYKRLPRKKKKALKKGAEQILWLILEERIDQVVREYEEQLKQKIKI